MEDEDMKKETQNLAYPPAFKLGELPSLSLFCWQPIGPTEPEMTSEGPEKKSKLISFHWLDNISYFRFRQFIICWSFDFFSFQRSLCSPRSTVSTPPPRSSMWRGGGSLTGWGRSRSSRSWLPRATWRRWRAGDPRTGTSTRPSTTGIVKGQEDNVSRDNNKISELTLRHHIFYF